MEKFIRIYDSGYVWHVPLEAIAAHRAKYYAARDKDTTYDEEFNFVMDDEHEGIDWFLNNMDYEDVERDARLVATPKPLMRPRMNSDTCEVSLETAETP
jgi:hypothetical protein